MTIPTSAQVMTFIITRDRDRAKAFYHGILGFALTHEDDFAAVLDLNGIALRISTVRDHTPQPHTVLGWTVENIEEVAKTLRDKNVPFNIYDGFGQDELGIWSPPGSQTKVAWFKDPDGNVLSLTQFD